ncbi:hypothetical protein [Gordonia sp. MMO-8]|uniref:hypothetical protein n=1 Tax=Gordonia sp. MMO-8 TaxID=3127886 RepID=UPI0030184335
MTIMNLEQHLAAHQLGRRLDQTLVCQCGGFEHETPGPYDDHWKAHRAHVAAAWREARTVRTVEELDALPTGAIIHIKDTADAVKNGDSLGSASGYQSYWEYPGEVGVYTSDQLEASDAWPTLVVWTPEDGAA